MGRIISSYNTLKCFMTPAESVIIIGVLLLFALPIDAQIRTPCSSSMLQSFIPCLSSLISSTAAAGGGSPSPASKAACCQSLKYLTSNATDCLCLIVTGSVPFRVPSSNPAALAISLPKACNSSGVPLQCKASAAPLPAPGPAGFSPTTSPTSTVSPPPKEDSVSTRGRTPSTSPTDINSGFGTSSPPPGFRPDLTPDDAPPINHISLFIVLLAPLGPIILHLY